MNWKATLSNLANQVSETVAPIVKEALEETTNPDNYKLESYLSDDSEPRGGYVSQEDVEDNPKWKIPPEKQQDKTPPTEAQQHADATQNPPPPLSRDVMVQPTQRLEDEIAELKKQNASLSAAQSAFTSQLQEQQKQLADATQRENELRAKCLHLESAQAAAPPTEPESSASEGKGIEEVIESDNILAEVARVNNELRLERERCSMIEKENELLQQKAETNSLDVNLEQDLALLHQKNERLEQELKQKDVELAQLKVDHESESKGAVVVNHTEELQALKEELEVLRHAKVELTQVLDSHKQNIADLQDQLAAKESSESELAVTVEELQRRLVEAQQQLEENIASSSESKGDAMAVDSTALELQNVKEQLEAVISENTELKSNLDTINKNHEALLQTVATKDVNIDKLTAELNELQEQTLEIENKEEAKMTELISAKEALTQKYIDLQQQYNTLSESSETLASQTQQDALEIKRLVAEVERLTTACKKSNEAVEELEGRRKKLERDLKAKIEEQGANRFTVSGQLDEIERLRERESVLASEIERLKDELSSYTESQQIVNKLSSELSATIADLKVAEADRDRQQTELENLNTALNAMQVQGQDWKSKHQAYELQLTQLRKELDESTIARQQLQNEIETCKSTCKQQLAQVEELTRERDALLSQIDEFSALVAMKQQKAAVGETESPSPVVNSDEELLKTEIVKKLLLTYFSKSQKNKAQIVVLIANVIGMSEAEKESIGIVDGRLAETRATQQIRHTIDGLLNKSSPIISRVLFGEQEEEAKPPVDWAAIEKSVSDKTFADLLTDFVANDI